jgi:hypothetical protein
MIGKITTGGNFGNLFNYLFKEEQGTVLLRPEFTNKTPAEIATQFEMIAALNPHTSKPVKHISLGFAPADGIVNDNLKLKIAESIVQELGYRDNQWIVVKHARDPDHQHDHVHICLNMITYDGIRIKDGFDKSRLQKILRKLEIEHKLTPVPSSQSRSFRRPKENRYRAFERKYELWLEKLKTDPKALPPGEPEIQLLESIIKSAIADKPTLTTYLARLQHLGYKCELYTTPGDTKGSRKRLRYELQSLDKNGNRLKISRINGGSLAQLKKAGVEYVPNRDNPAFKQIANDIKIEIPRNQLLTLKEIEANQYKWLSKQQQETILKHQKKKKGSSKAKEQESNI